MTILSLVFIFNGVANANPNYPFPQQVEYDYGIKHNNYTQNQMNKIVQSSFEEWKSRWLTQSGAPPNSWRVMRGSNVNPENNEYENDTASEGIGYGMLIMVLMDNDTNKTKQYFDGLFQYYKAYTNSKGLMKWLIDKDGKPLSEGSATDGMKISQWHFSLRISSGDQVELLLLWQINAPTTLHKQSLDV